ncbi:MAG: hypothetical protein ACYC7L_11860 [Nitrospirota bacterium]
MLDKDASVKAKCRELIENGAMIVIVTRTISEELMPSKFGGVPDFFPVKYEGNTVARCGIMCCGDRLGRGEVYDAHLGRSKKVEDALIADAADVYADYLVTEDKRLGKRMVNISKVCKVLTYAEFSSLVKAM